MDDTFAPVRDATAEALGTLLKVMGERPLNPYIEQLDKIKMDKVIDNALLFSERFLYIMLKTHRVIALHVVAGDQRSPQS